ncbi:MAG: MaoC/PaaZ C-terminal domain-containing protein [Gammaproteobacteria bacterium]
MSARVVLPGMPNLGRGYLGALATFARATPGPDTRLPATELATQPVHLDAERIARYNACCGFASGIVPITYPFVFTFPLQLALMTRADSPLRLPGLVHLGVDFIYRRALDVGAAYRASCAVTRQATTERGLEFALTVALLDAHGMIAWSGESRILARSSAPAARPRRGQRPRTPIIAGPVIAEIAAAANIGRRYAQVSGDWNPIHLGRLGARALGFERPIAHGMWTLARMIAASDRGGAPASLSAEFVSPLRLPGRLEVRQDAGRLGALDTTTERLVAYAEMKEIP